MKEEIRKVHNTTVCIFIQNFINHDAKCHLKFSHKEYHSSRMMEPKRRAQRMYKMKFQDLNCIILIVLSLAIQVTTSKEAPDLAASPSNQPPNPLMAASTSQQQQLQQQQPELAAKVHSSGRPAERKAHFAELETNYQVQTVAVGRPVRFKCSVNDIGPHKLAWFHKDRRILLAFDNKTTAWRERIQVSAQANKVFFLQIDSVQLSDKGQYMCQLNTMPVQSQIHILDVVKSPQIREQETSMSLAPVREFQSVELRCVADGIPKPVIKWRRESQMYEMPPPSDEQFDTDQELLSLDGSAAQVDSETTTPGSLVDDDANSRHSSTGRQGAPEHSSNSSNSTAATESLAGGAKPAEARSLLLLPAVRQRRRATTTTTTKTSGDDLVQISGVADKEEEASPNGKEKARRSAGDPNPDRDNSLQQQQQPAKDGFLAEGEVFRIQRVSRYDMGFYMCIASNGVPPSVSQRIFLPVAYAAQSALSGGAGNNNSSNNNNNNYNNNNNNSYSNDDSGNFGNNKTASTPKRPSGFRQQQQNNLMRRPASGPRKPPRTAQQASSAGPGSAPSEAISETGMKVVILVVGVLLVLALLVVLVLARGIK